jgi:hypothetical protein
MFMTPWVLDTSPATSMRTSSRPENGPWSSPSFTTIQRCESFSVTCAKSEPRSTMADGAAPAACTSAVGRKPSSMDTRAPTCGRPAPGALGSGATSETRPAAPAARSATPKSAVGAGSGACCTRSSSDSRTTSKMA